MGYETDGWAMVLAAVPVALLLLLLAGTLLVRLSRFRDELRNVNMELQRCSVRERPRWLSRRRRLWCWLFFLRRQV